MILFEETDCTDTVTFNVSAAEVLKLSSVVESLIPFDVLNAVSSEFVSMMCPTNIWINAQLLI